MWLSPSKTFLSPNRKYVINLFKETYKIACNVTSTLTNLNPRFEMIEKDATMY